MFKTTLNTSWKWGKYIWNHKKWKLTEERTYRHPWVCVWCCVDDCARTPRLWAHPPHISHPGTQPRSVTAKGKKQPDDLLLKLFSCSANKMGQNHLDSVRITLKPEHMIFFWPVAFSTSRRTNDGRESFTLNLFVIPLCVRVTHSSQNKLQRQQYPLVPFFSER